MDVTALPFNRLLGLEPADPGSGFLVSRPGGPRYTNHLGTVHAAALLAVAEAGSGAFLVRTFGDGGPRPRPGPTPSAPKGRPSAPPTAPSRRP
jgi:acyl-coenzyme A thioesterase PaaI-like protein